jgi:hypothetical protein
VEPGDCGSGVGTGLRACCGRGHRCG